jgi:nucleoside-diphosphate-sugar epimerase
VVAADRGVAGAVFNVSDGQPGTMTQYFKDVARALGLPAPPEVDRKTAEQTLSAGMLSYLKESRRINNEKLIKELQVKLQYPNLAAGLAQL